MKYTCLLLVTILISVCAQGATLKGTITDTSHQPLGFASIVVKGTLLGTSANSLGQYVLMLSPGNYTIIAQHVGYASVEKKITINSAIEELAFVLPEQQYNLQSVVVTNGEDPAYQVMRNAIKKRTFYENEIKKFETEVYIKGQLKLRDFPKKFFGEKVDFEDGDTSKKKMIFLSETVASYAVDGNNKKVIVTSTKVSGDKDGFGFSSPQIFSFYQSNVKIGNLNPRGFISPLSANAFNYYKFRFEGTFFENNKMVNRIKVIPKRTYEPLFNGHINIIEDEWRIHSVQLTLYKENQMQLADTVTIVQMYVPIGNVYVIKQQTILPSVQMMGFDAYGSFVQVYDKFNLNPVFQKDFFDNTILKFEDSSNKKPAQYWDNARPIPLTKEEVQDYNKKDSLEIVRKNPAYLDSLDRKRNKPNIFQLLTSGQTFSKEKSKTTLQVDALLDAVNFNTVEGVVINLTPVYTKRLSNTKRNSLSLMPNVRYGLSNKRFNASMMAGYTWGKKYFSSLSFGGGRKVFQYDNNNPIRARSNTFSSLYWERNYIKLYEAGFARVNYSQGLGAGFTITSNFEYQDRISLDNTSLHKWRDLKDRVYTPNITQAPHKSSVAMVNIVWQPGTRYVELPDMKMSVGSKYPTLALSLTQGIPNLLGSDVNFTKLRFGISDNLDFKLGGRLSYRASAGGFVYRKKIFFPDYQHYMANQLLVAAPFLSGFQLMPYYSFSNADRFSSTVHLEYHLNGLLTNKIPFFKKLNWFLVTGSNVLHIRSRGTYTEAFAGIENILKILRVDFVQSFGNKAYNTSGIVISMPAFLKGDNN